MFMFLILVDTVLSFRCVLDEIPNYSNMYKIIKASDPTKIENKNASSSVVTVRYV